MPVGDQRPRGLHRGHQRHPCDQQRAERPRKAAGFSVPDQRANHRRRAFQPVGAEHDFGILLRLAPQQEACAAASAGSEQHHQPVVLDLLEEMQDARKRQTGIDEDRRDARYQHEHDDDDRHQRHQDQDHRIDQRGRDLVANLEPARQQFGDLLEDLPGNASGFAGGQNGAVVRRKHVRALRHRLRKLQTGQHVLEQPVGEPRGFRRRARPRDDPERGIERQPGIGQRSQLHRKGRQFLQAEAVRLNEFALPDRRFRWPRRGRRRARAFRRLVGHATGFERRQPRAVQRVDRRIEAIGDDRSRRDRAARRVSLVLERCQGPCSLQDARVTRRTSSSEVSPAPTFIRPSS